MSEFTEKEKKDIVKLYIRLNEDLMWQCDNLSEYTNRLLIKQMNTDVKVLPELLGLNEMPEDKADFIKMVRRAFRLSLPKSAELWRLYNGVNK